MLKNVGKKRLGRVGGHFAIVASKYNARYVNSMVAAAQKILGRAGAAEIQVVRVPGAYEIPAVAAKLARIAPPGLKAIVCLGVILRGETAHAQLIGEAVSQGLMRVQIEHRIPVIHEVLLLENRQQAVVRCLDKDHNRGAEAARTAVEMARVMEALDSNL